MKHESDSNTAIALSADAGAAIVAEAVAVAPAVTFKASIEHGVFLAAVTAAARAIERTTMPILSNVMLRATDNGLLVAGTDLDLVISQFVFGEVSPGFAATVESAMLIKVLKAGTKGSTVVLEYSSDKASLAVRMGRYKVNLTTLPTEDWPSMIFGRPSTSSGDLPIPPVATEFLVPSADIGKALDRVQFAISKEETRYYLNGVYMHAYQSSRARPETLRFVATDGHRMAVAGVAAPVGVSSKGKSPLPGVIIPAKIVAEFVRLCKAKGAPDTVKVRVCPMHVEFSIGDTVVLSKLIDGSFPDYGRVLPTGNDKLLTVDRDEMLDGIAKASAISSERGRAVKLSLNGSVKLSASNPDSGNAEIEIDGEWDSDYLDIGFNSQYMTAILEECTSDVVQFHLADPGSPMLITGRKGGDAGVQFVLMPMRV